MCWFAPFQQTTPGHVLQWYGPNFHTTRHCVVFSQSDRTTFSSGTSRVCLGQKHPCVFERRATPLAAGTWICGCVVGCSTKGNLGICEIVQPKPPSLLLGWCVPQRVRAKTTQRALTESKGGAHFQQAAKLHKFLFLAWSLSRLSTQMRAYCLCSGETLLEKKKKKSRLVDVEVCESQQ